MKLSYDLWFWTWFSTAMITAWMSAASWMGQWVQSLLWNRGELPGAVRTERSGTYSNAY